MLRLAKSLAISPRFIYSVFDKTASSRQLPTTNDLFGTPALEKTLNEQHVLAPKGFLVTLSSWPGADIHLQTWTCQSLPEATAADVRVSLKKRRWNPRTKEERHQTGRGIIAMQHREEMTENLQGMSLKPRSVLMKTNHQKMLLALCSMSFGMTSKISQKTSITARLPLSSLEKTSRGLPPRRRSIWMYEPALLRFKEPNSLRTSTNSCRSVSCLWFFNCALSLFKSSSPSLKILDADWRSPSASAKLEPCLQLSPE